MGDGDGIGSLIGDVLGEVGGELAKIGKSAVGQVTGQDDSSGQAPTDKPQEDFSPDSQAAKVGQGIVSQITGKKLQEMENVDHKFSEQGQEEVKARINATYAHYAQKRKREERGQEQQEKQVEEQSKELQQAQKKQSMDVVAATTRANAEIKNMGAE